MLLLHNKGQQ